MRQLSYLLLIAALLLAACVSADQPQPAAEGEFQGDQPAAIISTPTTPLLPTETIAAAVPAVTADLPPTHTASASPSPIPSEATSMPVTVAAGTLPESVAQEAQGVISGQTAEGAFFYGDPNAPVTLIDYSDFL